MKTIACLLLAFLSLASCTTNTTPAVKTEKLERELDTLGNKIEEGADEAGDTIKAKFKDVKEAFKAERDSIRARRDNETN